MSCFHPMKAWRVGSSGRWHFNDPPAFDVKTTRDIYFSLSPERRERYPGNCDQFVADMQFKFNSALQHTMIPCGQCIGCRIDRSKEWAVRCYCEAKLHTNNYFVTLTYNNDNLPENSSLCPEDLQLFNKRLRYYFGAGVRFYACGEYGSKRGRPHYHIAYFNLVLDDLRLYKMRGDIKLWTSRKLSEIWGKGYVVIGELNLESAAYIARYISKKWLGGTPDEIDQIYKGRVQEFSRMSLKPGIGAGFYELFKQDVYPKDFITIKGVKYPSPRYFDRLLNKEYASESDENYNLAWLKYDQYANILARRIATAEAHADDNTPERLAARELCFRKRIHRLVRVIEDEEKEIEQIME